MKKNQLIILIITLWSICTPLTPVWGQNEKVVIQMNKALVDVAKRSTSFYLYENNFQTLAEKIKDANSLEEIQIDIKKREQTWAFYEKNFPNELSGYFEGDPEKDIRKLETLIDKVIENLKDEIISNGRAKPTSKHFDGEKIGKLQKDLDYILSQSNEQVESVSLPSPSKPKNMDQPGRKRVPERDRPSNSLLETDEILIMVGTFIAVVALVFFLKKNFQSEKSNQPPSESDAVPKEKRRISLLSLFKRDSQSKEPKQVKSNIEPPNPLPEQHIPKEKIDVLLNEIKFLRIKSTEDANKIVDLNFYIEKCKNLEIELEEYRRKENVLQSSQFHPSETFFMSSPNLEGSFNDSNRQPAFVPTSSLYKFEKTGTNKATFEFVQDERNVLDAIYQPEKLIEPVCEQENKAFNEAKNIETIKKGVARFENGLWVVKPQEKALVRYR